MRSTLHSKAQTPAKMTLGPNLAARRPALLRQFGSLASLLLCLAMPMASIALDPQYEADRLLQATETAVTEGNMAAALRHSQAAHALSTTLPAEFGYFDGLLLEHAGNSAKALSNFERYVHKTGKEGRFYKQSLTAITRLKDKPQSSGSAKQDITWGSATDINLSGDEYTQKMQRLYKAPTPEEGLRRHINSLLQFYGSPGNSKDGKQFYELEIDQSTLITLLRSGSKDQDTRINNARFSVYGLDPYVKTDCGKGAAPYASCWVKDPRTDQPWLIIKPADEGIAEIGKALTLLIRHLQR